MARAPLVIRAGTARDVPTILALIRGLAEYERLAHQMEATAARVRAHGFGGASFSVRGFKISEHMAGDSVSDTISEMTVAPAMVSANCR